MESLYLKSLLFFILIAFSGFGYAQVPKEASANDQIVIEEVNSEAIKAASGTYEFIKLKMEENFAHGRMQEILVIIEEKRHMTDTVYYKISDFTTVKIYPGK